MANDEETVERHGKTEKRVKKGLIKSKTIYAKYTRIFKRELTKGKTWLDSQKYVLAIWTSTRGYFTSEVGRAKTWRGQQTNRPGYRNVTVECGNSAALQLLDSEWKKIHNKKRKRKEKKTEYERRK